MADGLGGLEIGKSGFELFRLVKFGNVTVEVNSVALSIKYLLDEFE